MTSRSRRFWACSAPGQLGRVDLCDSDELTLWLAGNGCTAVGAASHDRLAALFESGLDFYGWLASVLQVCPQSFLPETLFHATGDIVLDKERGRHLGVLCLGAALAVAKRGQELRKAKPANLGNDAVLLERDVVAAGIAEVCTELMGIQPTGEPPLALPPRPPAPFPGCVQTGRW